MSDHVLFLFLVFAGIWEVTLSQVDVFSQPDTCTSVGWDGWAGSNILGSELWFRRMHANYPATQRHSIGLLAAWSIRFIWDEF